MQYRKLGKWGVRVSEIGLGSWLTYGGSIDEKSSIKQLLYAFDQGVNFFDTANVYAQGRAEEIVGKALQSLRRDAVVLATKVYFAMGDGPNDKGLSRKHVFEQCHASLRRLNTDYIDLYQCHRFDPDVPMEELIWTMADLLHQGKILYWGVSEWTARQIEEAQETAYRLREPGPISNQPFYNMLSRGIEKEVLPACRRLGMGQVVFSPLAQGVLSGKYKPGQKPPENSRAADGKSNMFMLNRGLMSNQTLELVDRLANIADQAGITMAQLALGWCLRLGEISSVIIGATNESQLAENITASGLKLSPDVLTQIEQVLCSSVA